MRAGRAALIAALMVLVALALDSSSLRGPVPDPDLFQRGVVFGLFARDEPGYIERSLAEIRGTGADAVSIILPWVTPHVRSLEIFPREDMTPEDGALRRAIRQAHRLGMRVFLMPILFIDRMEDGEWRGTLSPPDWKEWFGVYGRMILRYAALAQEERAEYLSVGSELCSTERFREDWLDLIDRVRSVYDGALTYSANWDHRESLSFVEGLDYLGTNAYFELARDPEATTGELESAWEPIRADLESWRATAAKPLIITEIGYPSRRGSFVDPWDYTREAPPDPAAQARAYRAFSRTWTGHRGLAGVYFYLWWGDGGPGDTGYTPRGKPAEEELRRWFQEDPASGNREREP